VNNFVPLKLASIKEHACTLAVYPSLLAMLTSNSNYTIFADDQGLPFMIDISEPDFITQAEQDEIIALSQNTSFYLYTR